MRSTLLDPEAAGAAPPDAFGPFRVLHQIGAGALGPVFRAYDPDQDRLVAVKLFQLDLSPPLVQQLVERFQRLVDADLAHPAVATPLGTGTVQGSAYLAQDFAAADSLETVAREFGAAPPADAARVAAQLAGALDFAAAVGVWHGMLHPRDVLLAGDDARLTGLGVAQALEGLGVALPLRSPYAAPERLAGDAWDRRADVFSLAVIVAEILSGHAPETVAALDGSLDAVAVDRPALRAVFARAMAERPDDRYQTALAFAEAVKQIVDHTGDLDVAPAAAGRHAAPGPPRPQASVPPTPRLPLEAPQRSASEALLPGDVPPPTLDDAVWALPGGISEPSADLTLSAGGAAVSGVSSDWDLRPLPAEPTITRDGERAGSLLDAALLDEQPGPAPVQVVRDGDQGEGSAAGSAGKFLRSLPTAGDVPSAPSPTVSSVWPIPLALMVGLIVGIAVGFFIFGDRSGRQTTEPLAQAAVIAPVSPVPLPPVAVGPPAVPADASATASPQPATSAVSPPSAAVTAPPAPASGTTGTVAALPAESADARGEAPSRRPEPVRRPERTRARPTPATRSDAVATRSTTASGRLLVRSSPAGARVTVNGRDVGTTPVTVRVLPFGTHTVRLARDGYVGEERRITISATQPAQSLTVDLSPPVDPNVAGARARFSASLNVESRPAGASVYLDGRRIGTTPLTMDAVAAGSHVVRLELDGYRHWSSSVRVAAGERNRVTASLEQ